MPKVQFPNTLKGWVVVLGSSMIGFVAGTASLAWLSKLIK